jgi:hypothetical protein
MNDKPNSGLVKRGRADTTDAAPLDLKSERHQSVPSVRRARA